jgi:hypothetical protein
MATTSISPNASGATPGLHLVIDNTRPQPVCPSRTDCFSDEDGRPLPGTPAPSPCPFFCGGGVDQLQLVRWGNDRIGGECRHAHAPDCGCTWHVDCMCCGAEGPHGMTPLKAAEGWNRRPGERRP